MTKRGEIFVGGHKMALIEYIKQYFGQRRVRKEENNIRDRMNYLMDVARTREYSSNYRNRDSNRPETEFERRFVYDSMHDVKGKDWPGW